MSKSARKTTQSVHPKIVASSETSRFHIDTITTLSREIDLKKVNVSVGNLDLIVDAHLKLKAGVHYALVGRNGEGKSVLLRAIADKSIPGIPENMWILLVNQIQEESSHALDLSITQYVVQSDARREVASEQYELLSTALTESDSKRVSVAIATVQLARARKELEQVQSIASRRSGARGAEARKLVPPAEARVTQAEARLERAQKGEWGDTDASEASTLLAELQSTLDVLGASTTEARARGILLGLGFSKSQLDEKMSTLSGGWRSRSSLASALLQVPDLLILDEPTNYLDLMSVIWLQEYLASFSPTTTILVVAHDRDFVDTVAQEIITLRHHTLAYFTGNLSSCERHARKQLKGRARMKDAMDKRKEAMERTIAQGFQSARKTGDENRARMAKSRQKKLDERWGLERSDKGGRFKLNRDMAGYHASNRAEITLDQPDSMIHLSFPDPEPMRFPGALISASKVSFSYPGHASTKGPVLVDVSLTIHPGSRTGFVGRNGEGKSTLVRILIGSLAPDRGTIERHPRLRLGYFDQHSIELLSSPSVARASALAHFMERMKAEYSTDVDEGTARAVLGSFGLGGRRATDPIATLSGGQKVRVALAIIIYPAPDLLVLDEPSTHLDMDTISALIVALKRYSGAVLVVSHDRHFVRCVIQGAPILPPSQDSDDDTDGDYYGEGDDEGSGDDGGDDAALRAPGEVYMVGPKGRVKLLSNGVDEYAESMERKVRKLASG